MEGWHDCGRWKSRENFIQREMGEVVGGANVGLQKCGEGKRLAFVFGLFQPLSRPLKDGMNESATETKQKSGFGSRTNLRAKCEDKKYEWRFAAGSVRGSRMER